MRAFRAPRGAIDALELFLNTANWSGRIENDSKSMICYVQCCNQDPVEAIMCSGPAGLILSILQLKNNQCFIFMKRDSSCQSQKSRKRAHECIFKITKSIRTPCQSQKCRKRGTRAWLNSRRACAHPVNHKSLGNGLTRTYLKSRRAYARPVNHKSPGNGRTRVHLKSRRAYARPVNHKSSGNGRTRA